MEKKDGIELSIVIPTIGRKKEVIALFESVLSTNLNVSYEIIVIDQNEDNLIDEICKKYKKSLPITQYKVQFKGASKARNYGIEKARGKIACFPDDDAEFSGNTVVAALYSLKKTKADCVFGKVIDKKNGKDVVMKFRSDSMFLSLDNFEGAFVEATTYAYVELLKKYPYDENMGVGTIRGSEEAYDLVYRLLKDRKVIYYDPTIIYYHPDKIIEKSSDSEIRRAFYYSCGYGYLCKKHKFEKKYKKRARKLTFGIPVIAVLRNRELKYFMAQWMGLRLGYKYL